MSRKISSLDVVGDSGVTLKTIRQNRTIDNQTSVIVDPTIAPAKTGTLTTRTDNDTGVLTMANGHGITTGATLDVYWSGGKRCRLTVGTVSGNSVPIDGGAGDNLPVATTAIVAMIPQDESFGVDDTRYIALAAGCAVRATVSIMDAADALIAQIDIDDSGAYIWDADDGSAGVLDDVASYALISHSDSSLSRQVNLVALLS